VRNEIFVEWNSRSDCWGLSLKLLIKELAPELKSPRNPPFNFDRPAWIQAISGLVIGFIALFSSYDHVQFFGNTIHLNQQWGVWLISSSLALVFIDAQLAARSRLRTAIEANRERNRADQERNRAAEARECQAEATERQGQGIALLRGAALLNARYQLDPSELNRSRLKAFFALLAP